MTTYVPITRFSRCKRYAGAKIQCPKCQGIGKVYHLSWSAITCQNCREMINKYDWFIEKGQHSKL